MADEIAITTPAGNNLVFGHIWGCASLAGASRGQRESERWGPLQMVSHHALPRGALRRLAALP